MTFRKLAIALIGILAVATNAVALASNPDSGSWTGGECNMWGGSYQTYSGTSYSYTYSPNCQGFQASHVHAGFFSTTWHWFDVDAAGMANKNWYLYNQASEGHHQLSFPWSPNNIFGFTHAE